MDQDMADRRDQSRKGHDKGACSYDGFQLHAEKSGKDYQHHHSASGTDKTCTEADGQSEEKRDNNTFQIEFFTFCRLVFAAGVRLYEKTDSDKEREE